MFFLFTVENFFFGRGHNTTYVTMFPKLSRKVTTYICTTYVTICSMFPKLSRKVTTYICTTYVTMFFGSRLKTFFFWRKFTTCMYHLCHYVFSFTVENFFFWRKFTTYIYTSHVNICSMFPKLSRKFTTYIYTSHVTMFFRSRLKTFFFEEVHNIYIPPMSLCSQKLFQN
jgi:hypothetical protein